jgi:DNA-binding transcriptional ArsR family regulator
MSEESFLLVSLDEDKSKKLAQVLSNDTSRKILDYLTKKDMMTETQISKELKIPLSTAHYNMSLLLKAKLVNNEHFTYSEKGKKIVHYSLSNKYVIIAPKKSPEFLKKLQEFLPVLLIMSTISMGIKYYFSNFFQVKNLARAPMLASDMIESEGATLAVKSAEEIVTTPILNQDFALWFLAGSIATIMVYLIWSNIIYKNKTQ